MIRNLLFDLGGVILDIKRENCIKAFEQLGVDNPSQYLGDYEQRGFFRNIEAGLITPQQFRDEVRTLIDHPVTDGQIDAAFNAFLVGIPVERLREIERLHRRYRIYMLSNTNAIMWDSFIKDEFCKDGHDMGYYFDGTVTSFEAKACKPDARIFRFAEQKLGIIPTETLFLDDSAANCEAARALGFYASQVRPGTEFATLIPKDID
mgnify:FL=1